MAGSISKLCTGCGLDVSDKPRSKDAQGRYFCQACGAKAAAPSAKPAAAPAANPMPAAAPMPAAKPMPAAEAPVLLDPIMEKVLSQALPSLPVGKDATGARAVSTTCNACSAAMSPGATICLVCGYNAATGKVMKTKVLAAEKEAKSASGSRRQRISIELGGWGAFVLCTIILGIMFALAMNDIKDDQMFSLFAATYGLMALVTMVMMVFTPFREGEFGWGIVILLSPFVPFLGFAVLYYLFAVTDRGSLKGMYVSCVLGYIMMAILVVNRNEAGVGDRSSRRADAGIIAPEVPPTTLPTYDFNFARSLA